MPPDMPQSVHARRIGPTLSPDRSRVLMRPFYPSSDDIARRIVARVLALYDPGTGGCRDGLHVDRVSQNQGAESTLAFLLSLAEMQALQNILASFKEPPGE